MTRRGFLVETVLLATAVVLIMANSLVYYTRVDLTENRLHTVSDATRSLLTGIENQVSITYYLSQRLSVRYPQPREIVDLLDEYAAASRGKVTVRVVDPASRDRPEEVESLGVVPQQLQTIEDGEQRFSIVYSGIVIEHLDERTSIPFVFNSVTLEYDLTTSIQRVVSSTERNLAILIGDPAQTLESTYRLVSSELSRGYRLRTIRPGESIPDDVDVAILTDAQYFGRAAMGEVRDYLDRGGAVLVAAEAVVVDLGDELRPEAIAGEPVRALLGEYGITMGTGLLLDQSYNQIRVEEIAADFRVQRAYPYPHWPVTLEQYSSADHPVTARFPGLDLYWPTWLDVDGSTRGATVIVASTPRSWLMLPPFELSVQKAEEVTREAAATSGQYGLVAAWVGSPSDGGRLAVVADSDFLRDVLIQASGSVHNVDFVQNLAEWLSNDETLLEIRTRPIRSLSLSAIDEPALEATLVFMARTVNLVAVPGAVVLYGLLRLRRRRRRARPKEGGA